VSTFFLILALLSGVYFLFTIVKSSIPHRKKAFLLMIVFVGFAAASSEDTQNSSTLPEQNKIVNVENQVTTEIKAVSLDAPAEKTLIKFIEALKNSDWNKAVKYTQLTWQGEKSQADKALYIKQQFEYYKIKSYKIESKDKDGEASKSFTVKIVATHKLLNTVSTFEMNPNVICEIGMRQPDPNGEWGVNPISAIMHQI
jgi:hypothetical protein